MKLAHPAHPLYHPAMPSYPPALENYWIDCARRVTGAPSLADATLELEPAIRRLSDLFTTDRPDRFEPYVQSAADAAAYGLFFFPQSFIKTQIVLAECCGPAGWRLPDRPALKILDLGAGTGASGLAVGAAIAQQKPDQPFKVWALDHSGESLRHADSIAQKFRPTLWPQGRWTVVPGDLMAGVDRFHEPWDIILLGATLNEVLADTSPEAVFRWVENLLSRLAPDGLLLILEPALHRCAERLEILRDALSAARAARILGPCLHAEPCPLLRKGGVWCHEVRRWETPASLVAANRRLAHQVAYLKFCFLALTPPAAEPAPIGTLEYARLVAPIQEQKGKVSTWACAADGRVYPCEIQTRHLSRTRVKELTRIERGERIQWVAPRILGDPPTLRAEELNLRS